MILILSRACLAVFVPTDQYQVVQAFGSPANEGHPLTHRCFADNVAKCRNTGVDGQPACIAPNKVTDLGLSRTFRTAFRSSRIECKGKAGPFLQNGGGAPGWGRGPGLFDTPTPGWRTGNAPGSASGSAGRCGKGLAARPSATQSIDLDGDVPRTGCPGVGTPPRLTCTLATRCKTLTSRHMAAT